MYPRAGSLPDPAATSTIRTLLITLVLLVIAGATAPHWVSNETPVAAQAMALSWSRTAVWESGFNPGALLDPGGVDIGPGGDYFVADRGHDRVVVIDQNGDIVRAFGGRGDRPDQMRAPRDVAVDAPRDRVYVVDAGNRRIAVFRLDGTPVTSWRTAGPDFGFVPHAVAVSPINGQVFVLSRLPWGFIDRFEPDGRWLSGWGDIGSDPGEFQFPEDLTVDNDGRVLVADTNNDRLQIFDATGSTVETVVPVRGLSSLAVERVTGRIYALHLSSGLRLNPDRVTVLDRDGNVVNLFDSTPPSTFEPGAGIAVGGSRMAISVGFGAADGLHGLRQYDTASGAPRVETMASPLDFGAFQEPTALEVAPDGSVLVIDDAIDVTRHYGPDGGYLGLYSQGVGDEIDVGPDGSIYLAAAPILGDVRLRKLDPDGSRVWDKTCDCLSGLGIAASEDRVFTTDAYRQRLLGFDQQRLNPNPVVSYEVADPSYAWLIDVDRGPDGLLYGAGGASASTGVYVFDPGRPENRALVRSWNLPSIRGGAERIAVSPEGHVFVLGFDGTIEVYDAFSGTVGQLAPEPAPGASFVLPRDIAAGPGNRLYLLDGASESVWVYDPAPVTQTPTPTPEPEPPCTVTGDKSAAPDLVSLGEQVTVQLSLDITCRPGSEQQADIVLILDRSNSMAGNRPGEKLFEARAAATRFVEQLDLARHRVAVISFSDVVSLDQALTADEAALIQALADIRADGRTDIAGALERALEHLGAAGRPAALPVVLLMTDGNPSRTGQPYVEAVRQSARARGRGALTYAIGLGDDVDADLLTAIVGRSERYFFAPTADELDPIYQQLSSTVGQVVATDLQVVDVMGADMAYVPGSASPAPAAATDTTVTWTALTLPAEGLRFILKVLPQRTGRLPTNSRAVAEYTAEGRRFSFEFPIPEVLVVDAPTPTPTPTATPTARPGTIYLPFLARQLCLPKDRERGVDVMLVIDSSSSMRGEKLDAAISAARFFLALVDARRDRVGLASFNSIGKREYLLTQDLNAVSRALDGLEGSVGTRIDLGLEVALEELRLRSREGTPKMMVLLSDGQPQGGTEDRTLELAQLARERSITIFTVGLGSDVDGLYMQQLARTPGHYRFAPDGAALRDVYESIAGTLPCR